MGGFGSTRWAWHTKKLTVEDCWELSIFSLAKSILPPEAANLRWSRSGSIVWRRTRDNEVTGSISYRLVWREAEPVLWLSYSLKDRRGDKHNLDYPVRLQSTSCRFGGQRWWFTCPAKGCGRRVGKLYLPPGGHYYACRHCYDLTYTSTQEAHRFDRSSIGDLARQLDVLTRAELIKRKLDTCQRGSKNWERLLARYFAIMGTLGDSEMDSLENTSGR